MKKLGLIHHLFPGASPQRCVAPVDNGDGRLCGADATVEHTIEGIVMPLCAEHAAELDRERVEN